MVQVIGTGYLVQVDWYRFTTIYLTVMLGMCYILCTSFFADGFPFSINELGFWTNIVHWVRVLDASGSYMYFLL
jgi:hypothetical protein